MTASGAKDGGRLGRGVRLGAWAAACVGALALAGRPIGPLAPLGALLDPVRGVWSVGAFAELPASDTAAVPGLAAEVRVVYDDRWVPHVFASSAGDAHRALGFVVARDRLFQMEAQTRATAGTLSGWVGRAGLDFDRETRRLGLAHSAERDLAELEVGRCGVFGGEDAAAGNAAPVDGVGPGGPAAFLGGADLGEPAGFPDGADFGGWAAPFEAIQAYADGVNAWVGRMAESGGRPFEHHMLGARPAAWRPVHSLYVLKRMGWVLTFNPAEARRERVAAMVGYEAADALFPADNPVQEPVVPHRGPRFSAIEIPDPGEPTSGQPTSGAAAATGVSRGLAVPEGTAWFGGSAVPGGLAAPGESARSRRRVASSGSTAPGGLGWFGGLAAPRGPSDEAASALGSNSWAVGPGRSESGRAILAGDPHLGLSLPSIWYEAHLVVPGAMDVYGVTLAGVPAIVIGFNRHVAWTFTNTGADVMDLYLERLDDETVPSRYFLDGEWAPLEARIERFLGPRGRELAADTVLSTHRGPVIDLGDGPASLRWTVLEECGELGALMRAARAESAPEWLEAMANWGAPAQVGLVADRDGRIAVQSAARYPARPGGARGDAYFDGATRQSDWLGRQDFLPVAVDPPQGYLASANQQPVDPEAAEQERDPAGGDPEAAEQRRGLHGAGSETEQGRDPNGAGPEAARRRDPAGAVADLSPAGQAYLGSDWPDPWRALTINELLRSRDRHGAADLAAYQTHPTSVRARLFRDAFLAAAAAEPVDWSGPGAEDPANGGRGASRPSGARGSVGRDASSSGPAGSVATAVRLLAEWDGTYAPDNRRAVLFEEAMAALDSLLWDELDDETGRRAATPREAVLWTLASFPESGWWDMRATPEKEDRDAMLRQALAAGLARTRAGRGPEDGEGWAWGRARQHNVHHLLRIPALSRLGLEATGGPGLLTPLTRGGSHGASWRMVVELDDEVAARGTYPGGQSGNPLSGRYDDRLDLWVRGELADLRFPRTEAELRAAGLVRAELVLAPPQDDSW